MGIALSVVIIIVVVGIFLYRSVRTDSRKYVVPKNIPTLLDQYVWFYRQLNDSDKAQFESRIKNFLEHVYVRGVEVNITDADRVMVAAGAIIPIFRYEDWRYNNISEVLLYGTSFNREYDTKGAERNVLGIVGDGALNREMILSLPSLRSSFANPEDGHNTAIHEFVHLIDKADGTTDGVPEYLLSQPYAIPWIKAMHETIAAMKSNDANDINFYGATNEAEFFAVISEYFFERPQELQHKHPELYALLTKMFQPSAKNKSSPK